jgi:tetratricopeptide (TPR) repeat protein
LNIDPTCVDVLINRGVAASRLGRLDIAIESYSLASKYEPMNDQTHEAMGYILNKIGDYKKAIDCLTKAIELNPHNYNALNNRAVAFYQEGDFDSALVDAKRCFKHEGTNEFYNYLISLNS